MTEMNAHTNAYTNAEMNLNVNINSECDLPLSVMAQEKGIRYFLISFMDLFGVQRSKLVPAMSIDAIAKDGAGFGNRPSANS